LGPNSNASVHSSKTGKYDPGFFSHNSAHRVPTLPEKIQIIDEWFSKCSKLQFTEDSKKRNKGKCISPIEHDDCLPTLIDMEVIAQFLVDKKLTIDID